jgi:hypothetical protein
LEFLGEIVAAVGEHFRYRGQGSGHHTRKVPAINHRVTDFRSGDNETNVVSLGAFDF